MIDVLGDIFENVNVKIKIMKFVEIYINLVFKSLLNIFYVNYVSLKV